MRDTNLLCSKAKGANGNGLLAVCSASELMKSKRLNGRKARFRTSWAASKSYIEAVNGNGTRMMSNGCPPDQGPFPLTGFAPFIGRSVTAPSSGSGFSGLYRFGSDHFADIHRQSGFSNAKQLETIETPTVEPIEPASNE
jgi:hypothetical protein